MLLAKTYNPAITRKKSDLWLIIVVFLQFSMSFTQIDVFFIVLGKSHISFTQIDEILTDLGKTR